MSSRVPFELKPINEEGPIFNRNFNASNINYPEDDLSHSSIKVSPDNSDPDQVQKFMSLGLEITSAVIRNVMSHPCMVLRRQCQVNKKASKYHLSPITLIPVFLRLQNRQGLLCLWKGCSGIFILRGCAAILETIIAELTPFTREVSSNSSLKQLSQHLLLKLITFGILTPFYCASLVETVQSGVASDTPNALDCVREGFSRVVRRSPRLLPLWYLVAPTAAFRLTLYTATHMSSAAIGWLRKKFGKQNSTHSISKYLDDLSSLHLGTFFASLLLYPAETVLHRLYLQGTRTILDDLDSGTTVVATLTTYEGVSDCFRTIVREEGTSGLYKGLGALILEAALQTGALAVLRFVLRQHLDGV